MSQVRLPWPISRLFEGIRPRQQCRAMPRILVTIALILLAPASYGEERVRIPGACRELADRFGVPLTLTVAEAKRAIAYINILSSQDPAVVRCRLALRHSKYK
jgi:hypothetical protein